MIMINVKEEPATINTAAGSFLYNSYIMILRLLDNDLLAVYNVNALSGLVHLTSL